MTTTLERITIRLEPGEEAIPGEYTLRDGATLERRPSPLVCPYCREPMTELVTDGALRIFQPVDEPRDGAQLVEAEPVPNECTVVKCEGCSAFFVPNREDHDEHGRLSLVAVGVGGSKVQEV